MSTKIRYKLRKALNEVGDELNNIGESEQTGILSPEQKAELIGLLYDSKESILKIAKYASLQLGVQSLIQRAQKIEDMVSSFLTDIQKGNTSKNEDLDSDNDDSGRVDLESNEDDSGQHIIESKKNSKKKLHEKNWRVTIDVENEFEALKDRDEEDTFDKQAFSQFIKKLERCTARVQSKLGEDEAIEYEELIYELKNCETLEDFETVWNSIYDWADDNDVWIKAH